jgi:uncharacterized protein (DUF1800 family)
MTRFIHDMASLAMRYLQPAVRSAKNPAQRGLFGLFGPFGPFGPFGRLGVLGVLGLMALLPQWAAAQAVTSFSLINADTGAVIETVRSVATVSTVSTPRINVVANATGVKSVVFTDGTSTQVENNPPYAYKGNSGRVFKPWSPAAGTYVISARPHAGSGGNGTPGPTATLTLTVLGGTAPPVNITRNEAARFLAHATFGPTEADIGRVMQIGYSAWIDEQFAMPRSASHVAFFNTLGSDANDKEVVSAFWKKALTDADQLRQRMAYALSQIFVISLQDGDVDNHDRAVAHWLDMLSTHSFGNYRDLLQQVSLNPMMGLYLSHLGNQKADASIGRVPDENYAREVMQLFSIGLVELSPDGQPRTGNNGEVLETYTPADVSELAKVFTGWSWACPAYPDRACFLRGESNGNSDPDRGIKPMVAYPGYHSEAAKTFLGITIPARTSAEESLRLALNRLAAHPNVGPFLARQLIQRFTTSNPSPAYVMAVANKFNNNGAGVRGDLKAVLKEVLMHPEARIMSDTSGKVREPVLRLTAFVRAFPHTSSSGKFDIEVTDSPALALGQAPLHSASVFNFYRPGYVAPKTQSAARGLGAPELQIVNETSVAGYVNFMRDNISSGVGFNAGNGLGRRDLRANYSAELALATDATALVGRVTSLLTYGAIGPARSAEIVAAVNSIAIPGASSAQQLVDAAKRQRVHTAILLTVAAPEFVVIK